jgi:hypothetical protein
MNDTIRDMLVKAAKNGEVIYYQELGIGRGKHLGETLEEICVYEHEQKRPLLSAVVVSKVRGMPNPGFWEIYLAPKGLTEKQRSVYWARELIKVLDWWQSHPMQQ